MKYIYIAIIVTLMFSCGKKDYNIPSQRTRIESYLSSQKVNYVEQSGVYKYTYYTENATPVANVGDSVYIYYSGYIFNNGIRGLYTTNIESDATAAGFDKTYMDFSIQGLRLGNGDMLTGLDYGIQGSATTDSIMIFMTSDLAYGEKGVGTVPVGSSVAFKIVINKIVK